MEEKLQEYARLLVRVGLNVQRGQTLVISSPVKKVSRFRDLVPMTWVWNIGSI